VKGLSRSRLDYKALPWLLHSAAILQVNGEIQSDAQAEQRQRLREEARASAFARQVAALEAQLTNVRKERAASDSALKVKLEEALGELRVRSPRAETPRSHFMNALGRQMLEPLSPSNQDEAQFDAGVP
jgi:hypothetical protein